MTFDAFKIAFSKPTFVAAAFCAAAATYAIQRIQWRYYASSVLEYASSNYGLSPALMRCEFYSFPSLPTIASPTGPHPECAGARSAASFLMEQMSTSLGLTPYFYQASAADQRHNRIGSRSWYWAKDVTAIPSIDVSASNTPNMLVCVVDVDYYLDMNKLLQNFKPHLLYSFVPKRAARSDGSYAYTFDQDNNIRYILEGATEYSHPLWNYGVDSLRVVTDIWGIPWRTNVYMVDRRRVTDDRDLILLTPVKSWNVWTSWLANRIIGGTGLERLQPHQTVVTPTGDVKHYTRLMVKTDTGLNVSTAVSGSFLCATVSAAVDESIAIKSRLGKNPIELPQVQGSMGPDGDNVSSTVLWDYHRNKNPYAGPVVYCARDSVSRYQYGVLNYDPEAKAGLVPFMSPLSLGCYSPDVTPGNEQRAVDKRVIEIAAKGVTNVPFALKVMDEFLELMIPTPHIGHPKDADYLFEQQSRPAQRSILIRSIGAVRTRILKTFVKKEAYSSPNDPRVISTINGCDKWEYSTFMYSFSELLKTQPWYAFGRSPLNIANRVTEICSDASMVVNTDFSRFDGRVSTLMRTFERKALMRYFHPTYANTLVDLHQSQYNLYAVGRLGTKYYTGTARASGSPETSAFNTMVNAFIAFYTFRRTAQAGSYIPPKTAWAKLGIYGGDDGLTADVDVDRYVEVAASVGQKLTTEIVSRGHHGVKFLARFYGPDVWFGDNNSMCDLYRQLSKFHATVPTPNTVLPIDKLVEKSRSFHLTDRNTPVLGPFVRRVMRIAASRKDATRLFNLNNLPRWRYDVDDEEQFPNADSGWMVKYADDLIPADVLEYFYTWLKQCTTLEQLLAPPLLHAGKSVPQPLEAVVDGHVHPEAFAHAHAAQAASDNSEAKQEEKKPVDGRPRDQNQKKSGKTSRTQAWRAKQAASKQKDVSTGDKSKSTNSNGPKTKPKQHGKPVTGSVLDCLPSMETLVEFADAAFSSFRDCGLRLISYIRSDVANQLVSAANHVDRVNMLKAVVMAHGYHLTAPFYEELLKRLSIRVPLLGRVHVFHLAILAMEIKHSSLFNPDVENLITRVLMNYAATLTMHIVAARLPLLWGIGLHLAYNTIGVHYHISTYFDDPTMGITAAPGRDVSELVLMYENFPVARLLGVLMTRKLVLE